MTGCYSVYPKVPFCVLFAIEVKGDVTVCLCYSNCGWTLISLGDVKVTISLFVNSKLSQLRNMETFLTKTLAIFGSE